MKPEFHEDIQHKGADPMDEGSVTHFDYDAVDRALGWAEEMDSDTREKVATAVVALMQWFCAPKLEPGVEGLIGRRVLAAAWVLRPETFSGLSQTKLAALIGKNKMALSVHASEFSALFGVRNRGQSHGWQANGVKRSQPAAEHEQSEENPQTEESHET